MWTRIYALFVARNLEFFRDRDIPQAGKTLDA